MARLVFGPIENIGHLREFRAISGICNYVIYQTYFALWLSSSMFSSYLHVCPIMAFVPYFVDGWTYRE